MMSDLSCGALRRPGRSGGRTESTNASGRAHRVDTGSAGAAHTRSSKLATEISKIDGPGQGLRGARRRRGPPFTEPGRGPQGGGRVASVGFFSPVGERRIVPIRPPSAIPPSRKIPALGAVSGANFHASRTPPETLCRRALTAPPRGRPGPAHPAAPDAVGLADGIPGREPGAAARSRRPTGVVAPPPDGASPGDRQGIVTVVPRGTRSKSSSTSSLRMRTQPIDSLLPMVSGCAVPWMP